MPVPSPMGGRRAIPSLLSLELRRVEATATAAPAGVEALCLRTDAGAVGCRFHEAAAGDAAVLWVGGAAGGLDGPAFGLYPRLAALLTAAGIASLRLDYRSPNQLDDCAEDALLGIAYLEARGRTRVAVVGHSFGRAVAIAAGPVSDPVTAVAALPSQAHGTDRVFDLSPRPLLLIHGEDDELLP